MEFLFLADYPQALPLVAGWYYKQWGNQQEMGSVRESEKILTDYLDGDRIPLIIIARVNDEILGAIQLKYYEMDIYPNKEHWLGGVFVSENHRGRSIARKLVIYATHVAKSQNVDRLFLQTEQMDGGLYKKLGWEPVEIATYRKKKVLIMKKRL